MREPDWKTADDSVRLYCGDSIDCLRGQSADAVIVDPVWPNCPPGLLRGSERALDLFREILQVIECRTLVVMLGFDSDPRFLDAVPASMPFIRSQQMPYAVPSYHGRLLGGDGMAYVFGAIPKGRGVIPGRLSTVTSKKRERATGHPCPRADEHLKDLVRWWTRPGDLVMDPFAGTFSTAVGAVAHGRRFVGCEIDAEFFRRGVVRVAAELARNPLLEKTPKIVQRMLPGDGRDT